LAAVMARAERRRRHRRVGVVAGPFVLLIAVSAVVAIRVAGQHTTTISTADGGASDHRLSVESSPVPVAVGQTVTIAVVDESRLPTYRSTDFGDGTPVNPQAAFAYTCNPTGDYTAVTSPRGFATHAYAATGTYTVTVTSLAVDPCNPQAVIAPVIATAQVDVNAADAPVSNGPARPSIAAVPGHSGSPGQAAITVSAADDDGFIARLEVDWGDSSIEELIEASKPCQLGPNGWPSTPQSHPPLHLTHQYMTAGTHPVQVTAVSTDCDGGYEQRAATSVAVDTA
jgi:hypothetical protein